MSDDSYRIERIIQNAGSVPPSVALEIIFVLADRAVRVGPMGLRDVSVRALEVSADGRLRLPPSAAGAKASDDASGLTQLLFELAAGSRLPADPAARQRLLSEAKRSLVLWPGGAHLATLLQELGTSGPPDLTTLRDRAGELRTTVGGGSLRSWVASSVDIPNRVQFDDFDSPDSVTGSFPAGALSHQGAAKPTASPILGSPQGASKVKATPVPRPDTNAAWDAFSLPTWALAATTVALVITAAALVAFLAL